MQLRKFAVAGVARSVQAWWTRIGGQGIGSRLRFLLPGSRFDYEREVGDPWMNSLVAIVLKWIGDNYPKPLLRVSRVLRDGSLRPYPRHRMVDLVNRPNPYYSGRVMAKAICLSLCSDGNAYLVKIRNGLGVPIQLWWVPHWLMQPVWDAEDNAPYIRAYQFLRDYQVMEIPARDVIHFRDGLDPRNDRHGLAALRAQVREICTDNEASGYTAALLRNMGVPGLVAIPKNGGRLSKDQGDRLKERIRDTMTGDFRGDTLVLLSGDVELIKIGFTPEEMRLEKLPARAEARVCASLGVSPMVVGLPDPNKTYSNFAEANSAGWRHCIVPLQDLVAETWRYQLLNEFDDPAVNVVEYDYSHVEALQEDLKNKHDRVRADWQGSLITQNEARDELGYDPDPDGDRYFFELTSSTGPVGGDGGSLAPPGKAPAALPKPADDQEDDDADPDEDDDAGDKGGWRY